eukprot:GHVS01038155.1.p1 GENE.GHVS01038155.1~~GHVS01038155.1.p1  ORF type:complete len:693 (+),score=242.96 GHVS01038155.1:747-2825(+)
MVGLKDTTAMEEEEEEEGDVDKSIFKGADLRYKTPKLVLAVKEDSGVFDLFLFAPPPPPSSSSSSTTSADRARPDARSIYKMGVPKEDIDRHVFGVHTANQRRKEEAANLVAAAIAKREKLVTEGPEALLEVIAGLDAGQPFFALVPQDSAEVMRETQQLVVDATVEEVIAAAAAEEADRKRKREMLGQTVSGITDVISSGGGGGGVVGISDAVASAIGDVVGSAGSVKLSPAEAAADSISKLANGEVSIGEIERLVSNAAKAVGKTPFRRLLEERVGERLRLLEDEGGKLEEVQTDSTATRLVRETVTAARMVKASGVVGATFVFAELVVKNGKGDVLFGPQPMYCPYFSLSKRDLKRSYDEEKEEEDVIVFEVTLRSQRNSGRIVTDDIDRPLKVTRRQFSPTFPTDDDNSDNNSDDNSDNNNDNNSDNKQVVKCPTLVLGVRLLDVDYAELMSSPQLTQFVKRQLAASLNSAQPLQICEARSGSTIIGFYPGDEMTLKWDSVVSNPNAQIHRVLQLDQDYPSLVDKDDLFGDNEQEEEEGGGVSRGEEEEEDYDYPLYTASGGGGGGDGGQEVLRDKVLVPPIDADVNLEGGGGGGMAGWAWALIIIAIVIVVVIVGGLAVLYLMTRKKEKEEDESVVRGRSVGDFTDKADEHVGVGGDKHKTGIVVQNDDSKAVNRDAARRGYDEAER